MSVQKQHLPEGWVKVKLGEITAIKYGKGLPVSQLVDYGFPVFGANGVIGYHDKFSYEDEQLLISCRGANSGTINFSPKKCFITNNSLIVDFIVEPKQLRKTLFYFLQSANKERLVTGTAQPQVTINNAVELELSLPPLAEQHRIVAKIEELFSELDNGIENLKIAQAQLKIYRQALLKHAFEGKLTAQWREQNKDKLESAAALQQRIQIERAARYQQQLVDWQAAGQKGSKPKCPKTLPPLTNEELADFPELPESWIYTRLGLVIDEPTYGTSKKCDYEIEGTGVLRIPNVVSGRIDASDLKLAQFTEDEIATYKLNTGDILIIRSNGSVSIVGRCAVVSENDTNYLYAGYLIRLRPNKLLVESEYLLNTFSLHSTRKQIELKAKSTSGVNNINTGEIQSLIISLCGIEEQKVIFEYLEARLSEVNQLDQTITTALQQSDALRQSILKKSFSGTLVAQDAKDEPASILLERIKNEKQQLSKGRTN